MDRNDSSFITREAKKIKSIMYLGGKCIICGETNHIFLDFHHKDIGDKDYEVSFLWSKNWKVIKQEIEKCELLCCKCHRLKHYNQKRYDRLQENILKKIDEIENITGRREFVLSEEEKNKIKEQYYLTKNYKTVSKNLNLKIYFVKKYLFECGIYKEKKFAKIEEFFNQKQTEIITLYNSNISLNNILKSIQSEYSLTALEHKIKQYIAKGYITKRKPVVHNKIISDEDLIEEYLKSGASYDSLSKHFNVSKNTIRKRIKKLQRLNKVDVKRKTTKGIYE